MLHILRALAYGTSAITIDQDIIWLLDKSVPVNFDTLGLKFPVALKAIKLC